MVFGRIYSVSICLRFYLTFIDCHVTWSAQKIEDERCWILFLKKLYMVPWKLYLPYFSHVNLCIKGWNVKKSFVKTRERKKKERRSNGLIFKVLKRAKVSSSYHLCVECFSQLSFDSEMYTKSAAVANFVYNSESNESCEKHSTQRWKDNLRLESTCHKRQTSVYFSFTCFTEVTTELKWVCGNCWHGNHQLTFDNKYTTSVT